MSAYTFDLPSTAGVPPVEVRAAIKSVLLLAPRRGLEVTGRATVHGRS
jgi:hypothetical protein